MKNIFASAVITTLLVAAPVFAQSVNDENIKADVQALDKDNAALAKDQNTLARDRAAKAQDKLSGDTSKQAADSIKIGAVKTAIEEKKAEKNVDQKILDHHKDEMKKETSAPASTY